MPPANIVIPLDDNHHVLLVEESRAWVAETVSGLRVSITWMRQLNETLEDFAERVSRLGRAATLHPPKA